MVKQIVPASLDTELVKELDELAERQGRRQRSSLIAEGVVLVIKKYKEGGFIYEKDVPKQPERLGCPTCKKTFNRETAPTQRGRVRCPFCTQVLFMDGKENGIL